MAGLPVDELMRPGVPQAQRDHVAGALRQADPRRATVAATAAGLIRAEDSATQTQGVMDLHEVLGDAL